MSGDGRYNLRKRRAEKTSGLKRSKATAENGENGILKEIIGELKNIREKIDENRKENELKFEEIRSKLEDHQKLLTGKNAEMLREMKENQQKIRLKLKKNQNLQTEKTSEISRELSSIHQTVVRCLPIKDAILGEWKMVHHENFEGFQRKMGRSFRRFSKDVNFSRHGANLLQIGGHYFQELRRKPTKSYAKDNRFVKKYGNGLKIRRSVTEGKLIERTSFDGEGWVRIYERVQ